MRDGKLKITFEAGEIVVVSVNAGLDLAYQRLFESARVQLQQSKPPIEAGIQLIVFGCFWLEAICNEAPRDLVRASMKPGTAAEAAWGTLKQGRVTFEVFNHIGVQQGSQPGPGHDGARPNRAIRFAELARTFQR